MLLDQLVLLDKLVLRDRLVLLVTLVPLDQKVHQAHQVRLQVHPDRQVNLDHPVHLVIKEVKVPREALVCQGLLVSKVLLDQLANLGLKEHLDSKVHQGLLVLAVLQGHLEILDQLVVWVQVGQLALLEILATRGLLAAKVHLDNRVNLDLLDQLDL